MSLSIQFICHKKALCEYCQRTQIKLHFSFFLEGFINFTKIKLHKWKKKNVSNKGNQNITTTCRRLHQKRKKE